MHYYDCNGNEILEGMVLRMADGSTEEVYATTDAYGNEDLSINASNEAYLRWHPEADREYYSLSSFDLRYVEIIGQTEAMEMTM